MPKELMMIPGWINAFQICKNFDAQSWIESEIEKVTGEPGDIYDFINIDGRYYRTETDLAVRRSLKQQYPDLHDVLWNSVENGNLIMKHDPKIWEAVTDLDS